MDQDIEKNSRNVLGERSYILQTEVRVVASTSNVNPDERGFIVDSGASMRMISKTDLPPEDLETVEVSRLPTTVITTSGSRRLQSA